MSANKVHVRLNHPHGIVFDLKNGRKVAIKGSAFHLRGLEKGVLPVGLFGSTMIDASDWEEIQATYGNMPHFRNGTLFAEADAASADDHAHEKAELRHGREPVDVKNDPTIQTEEVKASEAA